MSKHVSPKAKYTLDQQGRFVIENYNESKAFSNFFPGIAGLWGVPMWAFYVNRGQCIASFGIESKDKSIMEFQPANKAYRQTSLKGFRTFIKVKTGAKVVYWEPFQTYLLGTEFKKKQTLSMSAHDVTLKEVNEELGLEAEVNYFTLPQEPFAALVRQVTVKNTSSKKCEVEIIDGLPVIVPYGMQDWLNKNLARTIEAWVKVRQVEAKTPYYQLNVEVSDEPEVKHIKEGNFFFAFDPNTKDKTLLAPIVEAECVFGHNNDFTTPANFLQENFKLPKQQQTSNRTPSAFTTVSTTLDKGQQQEIVSLYGYAQSEEKLSQIVERVREDDYIAKKASENQNIINEIKNYAFTQSGSEKFDLYSGHTFLDNILRGGLPVSLKTRDGYVAFNVYSRKHGDLERDYNFFTVAPTFYSQGNGNYRDVNQNRRNDVWFNTDVKDSLLVNFFNLSQADGFNPLVVKGTTFWAEDIDKLDEVLDRCVESGHHELKDYLKASFLPGHLLNFVTDNGVGLKCDPKDFLGQVLEICHKQELADHGEGFWTDHWTYNLDLVESYLALFPEELKNLLLDKKVFNFYLNSHYVLPRDQRYVLTRRGVRQYGAVADDDESIQAEAKGFKLRTKNGKGDVYYTTLTEKLLCLLANKAASLDPSGVGVAMEADKPNWYDALNGLPGLLGSSVSETYEVKRYASFLLESLKKLSIDDKVTIDIFEELATFIDGLANILSTEKDTLSYWQKSNDIKEHYRQRILKGISGTQKEVSIGVIKNFLSSIIERMDQAVASASNEQGFLSTYFYHEVTDYQILDKSKAESEPYVRPKAFKRHDLPLFLEGYVHALRAEGPTKKAAELYDQIRRSDLFDQKLKMYKVNTSLKSETEEIGRTRIFPSGWLENESIWLHMEYKLMLELLRCGLYEEFYDNFKNVFVPFLKPDVYGRSTLENSSFIASSAHEDKALHGQGFVARLSGSTAEFMHIWLLMNAGVNPFSLNAQDELVLNFQPVLSEELFTTKATKNHFHTAEGCQEVSVPKDAYAFNFLGSTLVVYHNPGRKATFGKGAAKIKKIELTYPQKKNSVSISGATIGAPYAQDVRDRNVSRIDVFM